MRKLVFAAVSSTLLAVFVGVGHAQPPAQPAAQAPKVQPPRGFETLTWLAGTRYIDRNGTKSYETWTGPAAGLVSGSVASATGGGLVEFFRIGPNEQGVYGLMTANSNRGLSNWTFRPLKSLEPGKIVFADASGSFS